MSKQRLDQAIEARGLLPSRARARDAVLRGTVRINGEPARKPSQSVSDDDEIILDDPAAHYVSRAALKLIAGLDAGKIDPHGLTCLDVGSSTGGFTQVLVERGAAHVFAVDVGHDQLADQLKNDRRVTSLEGTDARQLGASLIPQAIDLIVSDVSFVSLTKVLTQPLSLCTPKARAILLFKPQFEVGRDFVGKGGIVTDQDAIARALDDVTNWLSGTGWIVHTTTPSPISGGDGNSEIVLVLSRRG